MERIESRASNLGSSMFKWRQTIVIGLILALIGPAHGQEKFQIHIADKPDQNGNYYFTVDGWQRSAASSGTIFYTCVSSTCGSRLQRAPMVSYHRQQKEIQLPSVDRYCSFAKEQAIKLQNTISTNVKKSELQQCEMIKLGNSFLFFYDMKVNDNGNYTYFQRNSHIYGDNSNYSLVSSAEKFDILKENFYVFAVGISVLTSINK